MRGISIFEKPSYREIRPMRGRLMRGLPVLRNNALLHKYSTIFFLPIIGLSEMITLQFIEFSKKFQHIFWVITKRLRKCIVSLTVWRLSKTHYGRDKEWSDS